MSDSDTPLVDFACLVNGYTSGYVAINKARQIERTLRANAERCDTIYLRNVQEYLEAINGLKAKLAEAEAKCARLEEALRAVYAESVQGR